MSKSIVIVGAGGMPGGYNGNIYHEFSKTKFSKEKLKPILNILPKEGIFRLDALY